MALQQSYPAAVNSRQTELVGTIDDTQTSFEVLDGSALPDAPNLLTLGTDESAETILYTAKSGNQITGVTRGFEGVAKSWVAGTKLARYFTAYDHDTFRQNVSDLNTRLDNIPAPQDASLTQKGVVQLSNATESNSETEAATPKAINTVRQQADTKIGDLTQLQTTDKDNLVDALNEVFTSGSEFKGDVADAITAKGVPTSAADDRETFVQNIESIETSTVINGQQQTIMTFSESIEVNDTIYSITTIEASSLPVYPNGPSRAVFSHDGVYLAAGSTNTPLLYIYKRTGNTNAFTKLTDPPQPSASVYGIAFSRNSNYLAVAHSAYPFLTIYKRNGDTFTKLPDPASLPTQTGVNVTYSYDDNYLVVGNTTSPFITIYKRNGDTFTKLPDPSVLPPSAINALEFSDDGVYLALATSSSPYLAIYKRNGDTFTKLPDPAIMPPGTGNGVSLSPAGNYLCVGHSSSPFITIYKRNGDIFTKLPNPQLLPEGQAARVKFKPGDGSYLVVPINVTPYVNIYRREGDNFYKLANPKVLPTGQGLSADFSPDETLLCIGHVGGNGLLMYSTKFNAVLKGNNDMSALASGNVLEAGYALESGAAGDSRQVMILWRY